MKRIKLLLFFLSVASLSFAQSPRLQAEGKISGVSVSIDYGAPSVKGRKIWGGLEQYGKVWRAGANENTTVTFDNDVLVDGNELSAGKYGFFIIPNEDGDWTVIFNTKNDGWGAYSYNEKEDALRIEVTPDFVNDVQEQLEYSVGEESIDFAWEKVRISISVESVE